MLKVGFARIDITTPLGLYMVGYYEPRISDGILDPLLASAVVFDDGERRAVIMSVDNIGFTGQGLAALREKIAKAIGTSTDAVYLTCTHTHTAPEIKGLSLVASFGKSTVEESRPDSVTDWVEKRLVDVAKLAADDIAPATLSFTKAEVKDVSFVRRFRLKDGTVTTNPGWQNPEIDCPLGNGDDGASLLIIKRENKAEIGIVHFQVHPDVITGTKYSADFPKFVRDTYEANIPNSLCMFINGAEGDLNHIDVRLNPDVDCAWGYERSKYMGKKIAMSLISNYELAKKIDGDKVRFGSAKVKIKYHKGAPEEIEEALTISKIYNEQGSEAAIPGLVGMRRTQMLAKATRIVRLMDMPDYTELTVSAVAVGDVVFGGIPGEPFSEIGRMFKSGTKFTLALPTSLTNGCAGYFPAKDAYKQGAYEANSSSYAEGTAESIVEKLIEIADSLRQD